MLLYRKSKRTRRVARSPHLRKPSLSQKLKRRRRRRKRRRRKRMTMTQNNWGEVRARSIARDESWADSCTLSLNSDTPFTRSHYRITRSIIPLIINHPLLRVYLKLLGQELNHSPALPGRLQLMLCWPCNHFNQQ